MDPKPSFNFPLLQKRRAERQSVPPRLLDYLNNTNSFVFREDKDSKFQEVRQRLELSPRIGMKLNAGYRLENTLARSRMRADFKNHYVKKNREEFLINDKEFCRKRDEQASYTEHFFKNQILYIRR